MPASHVRLLPATELEQRRREQLAQVTRGVRVALAAALELTGHDTAKALELLDEELHDQVHQPDRDVQVEL